VCRKPHHTALHGALAIQSSSFSSNSSIGVPAASQPVTQAAAVMDVNTQQKNGHNNSPILPSCAIGLLENSAIEIHYYYYYYQAKTTKTLGME